jgi:chemotaxis protein histidine kinase CheA
MSKLTDKISYLQGLAEGMKLNLEKDANRLLLEMLDAMAEMADELEELSDSHEELSEYVDSIDEDLADLEADLFDDEDEDFAEPGDDSEEDGDEDEAEEGGALLYECPHCRETIELDPEELDLEEEHPCPNCGKELFPELPEETD